MFEPNKVIEKVVVVEEVVVVHEEDHDQETIEVEEVDDETNTYFPRITKFQSILRPLNR